MELVLEQMCEANACKQHSHVVGALFCYSSVRREPSFAIFIPMSMWSKVCDFCAQHRTRHDFSLPILVLNSLQSIHILHLHGSVVNKTSFDL